jgi:large subunit ribosomal protein L2
VALRKLKPTSPGQRFVVRVVRDGLHKGDPYEPLLEPFSKTGGRNNQGRITTRHQGGGRYILAPKRAQVGDPIMSGVDAPIKPGSALPLKNIPIGSLVHCIELKPGKGAQMARSAGASVQLVAREGEYVTVRLRSGEMRRVHVNCRATIGEVGNDEHNLRKIGKAGAQRWRGIRPTVRGVAQNPVDHPHGGGEGKSGQGNPHPVSPWGQKTKGYKTRRNKRTRSMIVRDRRQK